MLYALVLLGLLPAGLLLLGTPEDEEDGRGGPKGRGGDLPPLPDGGTEVAEFPGAPEDVAAAEARHVTVPPGPDETVISGFRPGLDRVTIRLGTGPAPEEILSGTGDDGAELWFHAAEGGRSVIFPGLAAVPAADIRFSIADPGTGGERLYGLEAAGEDEAEDAGADGEGAEDAGTEDPVPLDPADPEEPSALTPGLPEDIPLSPADPADPSLPTPAGPEDGPGLDPVTPPDPPAGPASGEGDGSGPEAAEQSGAEAGGPAAGAGPGG